MTKQSRLFASVAESTIIVRHTVQATELDGDVNLQSADNSSRAPVPTALEHRCPARRRGSAWLVTDAVAIGSLTLVTLIIAASLDRATLGLH